ISTPSGAPSTSETSGPTTSSTPGTGPSGTPTTSESSGPSTTPGASYSSTPGSSPGTGYSSTPPVPPGSGYPTGYPSGGISSSETSSPSTTAPVSYTTSTIYSTTCVETAPGQTTTIVIPVSTTVCPVTETESTSHPTPHCLHHLDHLLYLDLRDSGHHHHCRHSRWHHGLPRDRDRDPYRRLPPLAATPGGHEEATTTTTSTLWLPTTVYVSSVSETETVPAGSYPTGGSPAESYPVGGESPSSTGSVSAGSYPAGGASPSTSDVEVYVTATVVPVTNYPVGYPTYPAGGAPGTNATLTTSTRPGAYPTGTPTPIATGAASKSGISAAFMAVADVECSEALQQRRRGIFPPFSGPGRQAAVTLCPVPSRAVCSQPSKPYCTATGQDACSTPAAPSAARRNNWHDPRRNNWRVPRRHDPAEQLSQAKPLFTKEDVSKFFRSRTLHAVLVLSFTGAVTFYFMNIETVPVSGRRRFNCYSEAKVKAAGEAQARNIELQVEHSGGGFLNDWDPRTVMLRRVLRRLIPVSGMKDDEWEVRVIDNPGVANAFVLPGGKVFVYSGLIPVARDEHGLAAVLGHEIAHNLARHTAERMSSQIGINILLYSLMTLSGGLLTGTYLGHILLDLVFSRPMGRLQEAEADYIGLMMMAEACYDPRAALGFWERMKSITQEASPEWTSTHPAPDLLIMIKSYGKRLRSPDNTAAGRVAQARFPHGLGDIPAEVESLMIMPRCLMQTRYLL
ncbi:hypothetical protein CIB48_g9969, partial [Xylaria polymorpha]